MRNIHYLGLGLVLLLAGCQSLDKAVRSGEQAAAVFRSGTVQSIARVIKSDDPKAVAKQGLKNRKQVYKEDPLMLVQDVKTIKRDFKRLMDLLEGNVSEQWGKQESRLPSRKQYVKYTHNYNSRAIVDFDNGVVTIETLAQKNPRASLKSAIVTTLLTPDDPRAVDLFSAKEVELNSEEPPYLLNLVLDHNKRAIDTPQRAEAFAQKLLDKRLKQRQVDNKQAHYVSIKMVENFHHQQAEKYRPVVERYARQYGISPSLVFAVIQTESNFNPFAVSPIPAYGLMQLVPGSGGRDAYRHAKGKDGVPSKDYLFNAQNNIELGTAYLDVLTDKYLVAVQNDVSREYCVISAYNTGAGNVLRSFDSNRDKALNIINGLQPPEVYSRLRNGLPYAETRRYLDKVINHRKQFVAL